MNKTLGIAFAGLAAIAVVAVGFYMIDVDQTQEARLPDVDVKVEGGQAPAFNVETGEVKITEEKATVPVPEVKVEQKEITVPGLEVTPPEQDGPADNRS